MFLYTADTWPFFSSRPLSESFTDDELVLLEVDEIIGFLGFQ